MKRERKKPRMTPWFLVGVANTEYQVVVVCFFFFSEIVKTIGMSGCGVHFGHVKFEMPNIISSGDIE